jgi:hypothetical protein
MNICERSYERIEKEDLEKLLRFAIEDRNDFFSRHPLWKKQYANRVICIALCQGAAQHYVDGKNGVKDFDVWTFYAEHPDRQFYPRRMVSRDFGISKFGCYPSDVGKFEGRCVDLIGRSIKCRPKADPIKALRDYLSQPKTKSARLLSKKSAVMLFPKNLFGKVVWPMKKKVKGYI